MKRYNINDIYPKGKKKCFYKTNLNSLIKVSREYLNVGTGYVQFEMTMFCNEKKRWSRPMKYSTYQIVEQGKDWKQISEAEAFIEII